MGAGPGASWNSIKENWEAGSSDSKNEIQYVMDLRAKLHSVGVMSREHLHQAQERQRRLYDRGTRLRDLTRGMSSLYCCPPLAPNYSRIGKGPLWSRGESGTWITR